MLQGFQHSFTLRFRAWVKGRLQVSIATHTLHQHSFCGKVYSPRESDVSYGCGRLGRFKGWPNMKWLDASHQSHTLDRKPEAFNSCSGWCFHIGGGYSLPHCSETSTLAQPLASTSRHYILSPSVMIPLS